MQHWGAERQEARLCARLSQGRIGWAIRALEEERPLNERERDLQSLWQAMDGGRLEGMERAYQLNREPRRAEEVLALWCTWWRDLLLVKARSKTGVVNLDQMSRLEQQAARYSLPEIQQVLEDIQHTAHWIEQNANLRLALEVLLLNLARSWETEQG